MNQTPKAHTRDRLLAHARKLFAAKGFDGASVREITAAARANLGAVTYHFGSKRALYEAVLGDLMERLASRVEAAAGRGGAAPEQLRDIVHAIFDFFAANPDAPRFMLREIALSGGPPAVAFPYLRRNLGAITGVIRAGQQRGELRPVDPLLATFTLISQCVWFAIVRHSLAQVTGIPLDRPEHGRAVQRHITDVLERAFASGGTVS